MADQDFNIKVVTTADTSGLRQTSAEMDAIARRQADAEAKWARSPINPKNNPPGGGGGKGEVTSGVGSFAGPTALLAIGYEFISQLNKAAGEIQKISDELNKQGAQIVENAQRFSEQAKFATTTADVIKVGEGALKGVEAAHKNLLDVSQRELTVWQKIADIWAAGFKDKGPIAQALELQRAQADQNYQMERNNAIHEITAAQRTKDDLDAKTYTQKIEYLTQKIQEQENAQRRAGVANVEDYLKAGQAAENFRKILENINQNEQKSDSERTKKLAEADKAASASSNLVRGILANEEEWRKVQGTPAAEPYKKTVQALERVLTPDERADLARARQLRTEANAPTSDEMLRQQQVEEAQRQTDLQLQAQRAEPTASYKTAERIGRENRERADAEAREKAGGNVEKVEPQKPAAPSEAKPAGLPSPDVVTAIKNLETKFDRYWA